VTEREQPPGSLVHRHRPPPLLDQLDEPIRGVETQLHAETG
jgi:hypothetical protein